MVKTLNGIVESLLMELSGYKLNDDFPLDRDYLKDKIVGVNGSLMREEYNQSGRLSEQFYYPYFCNQVECVGINCIVDGIVIHKTLPVYKVTMDILQTGVNWSDVAYFGLPDMRHNFKRVTVAELPFVNDRRFGAGKPHYAKSGSDFWIVNLPTSGTRLLASMVVYADPRNIPGWDDNVNIFPTPSNYKLEMLVKADILKTLGMADLKDDAQITLQQPRQQADVQD